MLQRNGRPAIEESGIFLFTGRLTDDRAKLVWGLRMCTYEPRTVGGGPQVGES